MSRTLTTVTTVVQLVVMLSILRDSRHQAADWRDVAVSALANFRFDGKRAVLIGGATGMGAAAASLLVELGADVLVLDHVDVDVPGVSTGRIDLRDPASIDSAIAACGTDIDALLCCAGVNQGVPGLSRINFIGHRHFIDGVIAAGALSRGSAIGMISSTAGMGWEGELPELLDYLATPGYDEAVAWIEAHPDADNYRWAKQAVNAFVASRAHGLLQRGIRINAILPGPTDTPFGGDDPRALAFGQDYREDVGISAAIAEDQAYPLVFLCSDAARYISGAHLVVDAGYMSSGFTRSYEPAARWSGFLMGKIATLTTS
jgi:NAD(P)-dependent dehydrogenase (short-subunit alcohol dehydrogenase family)